MAFLKRFFLFGLVNILILVTLSFVFNVICNFMGITPSAYYRHLVVISLGLGFGGAIVSLLLSKWTAKTMMGVRIIDPNTTDSDFRRLVDKVHTFARAQRLTKMPEVGIYDSPEVNAFATGPSKNNSLVAVSTGLLQRMNSDQVDGVLAHEVAHIANGDMVTMTLLQGVMNAVVIFAARILASLIVSQMRGNNSDERPSPILHMGIVFGLEMIFSILGMIVVNYFSRLREYRADLGGAKAAGRDKMIGALRALQGTLKISGRSRSAMMALFSTHPSLEERIARLERAPTA